MSSQFFSTFFVVLLLLGRPERSSSSTGTRPALRNVNITQKLLSGLKSVVQKHHEAFQGFREWIHRASRKT
jgi:hypothetical protein